MFKKGMAYLLPTTKAQNCLYKNKGTNKLEYHKGYLTQDYLKNSLNAESFHLCIIDSEKINDLDNIDVRIPLLFISSDGTSKLITYSNVRVKTPGEYYRILATTDESLVQFSDPIISKAPSFPKPSISFIKKYIEEYNKSNIIIDIMVEYEGKALYTEQQYFKGYKDILKINPKDSTITIKKIKDNFTFAKIPHQTTAIITEYLDKSLKEIKNENK